MNYSQSQTNGSARDEALRRRSAAVRQALGTKQHPYAETAGTPLPTHRLSYPQPMLTFEPTMPADVHDQLTDKVIRWKPEWSETWYECRYYVLGVVEWKGLLLDGWAPTQDALD